jgi:diadenylate cyclase
MNGARLFRVHDVAPNRQALDVAWGVPSGRSRFPVPGSRLPVPDSRFPSRMNPVLEQLRLLHAGPRDLIEVLVVAFVLYRMLLLIQGTRAVQMLTGIVMLVLVYAIAWLMKLTMITYLLELVFTYGAFAALIIFQPELRAGLAHLGQSRVTRFFRRMEEVEVAEEVSEAVERLARSGIGAIIVLEREMALGDYIQSGSEMQAKVSADLLATIFTPYSPTARRSRDPAW